MIGSFGLIGTPAILRAGKKEEVVVDSREDRILRKKMMLSDPVNDHSMMENPKRGSSEERGIEEATVETGEKRTENTMIGVETVKIEAIEGIEEKEIAKTVDSGNIVVNVIVADVNMRKETRGSRRKSRMR